MALVRARGLVLQTFAYGDTSKILRLFTVEHGLRSVIAKGAQRARSRYGALLEPFTEGEAQIYLKEGRDLHTLGGFDLIRSRQALGRDLSAFAGASLVSELILRFGTEEPYPELYQETSAAFDRLTESSGPAVSATALSAVWRIISLFGYHPELETCIGCGRALDPREATRFDVHAGGAACMTCRPTGRVVDPETRAQVALMSRGQPAPDALSDRALHRALVRAFLGAHLAAERPLRSLDLFLDTLR